MSNNFYKIFEKQYKENKLVIIHHAICFSPFNEIFKIIGENYNTINLSEKKKFKEFNKLSLEDYNTFFKNQTIVIIEAQLIKNFDDFIIWCLKEQKDSTFILLCSATINIKEDMLNFFNEQNILLNYHSSFLSKINNLGLNKSHNSLNNELIFGSFSNLLNNETINNYFEDKINYIIKILSLFENRINKKEELIQVLKYIALKSGENVSFLEIGKACNIDNETVEKYILLLNNFRVILFLKNFSNNYRYEIKKGNSIYFYDNGLRNYLINNFEVENKRFDLEFLWKNWLISEKFKTNNKYNYSFWLTHTKQKIDFIEIDNNNEISAFLFNWNNKKPKKNPELFLNYYPKIQIKTIHKANFLPFLMALSND